MADIIETAKQTGKCEILIAAIKAAGLTETLKDLGPYTIFAPSDEAFDKLPAKALTYLLTDMLRLRHVLLAHIVAGEYLSDDLVEDNELQSIEGKGIKIIIAKNLKVNNAIVLQADIECDNGIIHLIDAVMMPKVEALI